MTQLKQQIESLESSPNKIIWIICRDPFMRQVALQKVMLTIESSAVIRKNFIDIDSSRIDDLFGASLFKKASEVVVLDEVDASSELAQEIVQMPSDVLKILLTTSCTDTNLLEQGIILRTQDPKPWEKEAKLKEAIQEYVQLLGAKIAPNASQSLAASYSTKSIELLTELQKIVQYTGDKIIDIESVEAVSTLREEKTIWQLYDALIDRNSRDGFVIGSKLASDGAHPLVLLRQLRNQTKQSLEIRSLVETKQPQDVFKTRFPNLRDKMLDKVITASQKQLKTFYENLLISIDATEDLLKRSVDKEERIFEKFLLGVKYL